jgi:hypothetical protein
VVTLDRSFGPTAHVRVTPRAAEAPAVEGAPITLRWVRQPIVDGAVPTGDERDREPEIVQGAWLAAMPEGDAFIFQVRSPGKHQVRCEIAEGGVVIAVLETEIEVRETQRSDPGAYRTSRYYPDEPWTRAIDEGVQVKRGEDLIAAWSVSGQNLQESYAAKHAQLATDGTLTAEQRAVLADEVSVLGFAAAERKQMLPMPTPTPGAETIEVAGHVLTDDPVYLRALLEGIYSYSDAARVEGLLTDFGRVLLQPDPNDVDDPLARFRDRIMPMLREQWATLRGEIDQFVHEFYWRARNAFHRRLGDSERVASQELERYTGISFVGQPMNPDPPDPAVEAPKLVQAAAELKASQEALDDIRLRYRHAVRAREQADDLDGDFDRDVDGMGEPPLPDLDDDGLPTISPDADLGQLIASLERMIHAAELEHSQRVILATAEFPILASYKRDVGEHVEVDAKALGRIGAGNVESVVRAKSLRVWQNIIRTRAALEAGDLDVWKQPRVLDLARAEMLVTPGSVRDRAIANKVAAAQGSSWEQWALIALTLALSVAAAIPTGGSSIAAGVVATAEVLSVAAGIYTALDALESYQIETAAARTDFDKARAISASEPSLLWVAVDIVMVGVDIKSMVTTFRAIRAARASAKAGGAVDEAIAVVQAEHHAGRLSAEVAERLEREIAGGAGPSDHLAQRVADDLVEDGDDLLDAARAAPHRRVAPDGEHVDDAVGERTLSGPGRRAETRARVRPEDVGRYERKLGAAVEPNPSLEDGVRVHFVEAGNGDLLVTRVEVGPLALVDDVLAHRRTIARLTRYNGVVGQLRRLWDELVALLGGSVHQNPFRNPPFGPGSRAFESFEEMHKLDELIRARRAAWTPDALNADLIDDEIRHLQGELTRHAEVVRDAKQTLKFEPGRGFVERPDVRARTHEATASGWPLPADAPDAYYYRLSDTTPGAYELARLPSAPKDLPSLHAEFEIVAGVPKPTGKIVPRSELVRAARVFSDLDSPDEVLKGLRESPSTSAYLDMLTKTGDRVDGAAPLATADEVTEAIADVRRAKGAVNEDDLRHALKERFRKRVEDFINDASLDNAASYQRMRNTLDGLGVSDKGNLTEVWYQRRYAKDAERHTSIGVTRTDAATGDEWLEDRKIDLFDGKTATEVKSGAGSLGQEGKDQFLAYLDMAEGAQRAAFKGKASEVKAIKYVFTDAAGARRNLPWMAKTLRERAVTFSFEVFDETGSVKTLRSVDDIEAFLVGAVR